MTSAAQIQINMRLDGADQVQKQLADTGKTAVQIERQLTQIERQRSFGQGSGTGLGSFGRSGGPSARQGFRMDQVTQNTITGALGANNAITSTIDQLERLQFMAQQTGQSFGKMFAQAAPGAIMVAGAALGFDLVISKAQSLNEEIQKLQQQAGQPVKGFWQNWADGIDEILGIGAPVVANAPTPEEVDATRAKARATHADQAWQALQPQTLQQQFTEWFKAQEDKPTADQAKKKYDELATALETERKATAEAASAKDRARKIVEDTARKVRDEDLQGIKDSATQRTANDIGAAYLKGNYQRVFDLSDQTQSDARDEQLRKQAADRAAAEAKREAEKEAQRFTPAVNAWRSELGGPAGNSGTTRSDSAEAVRAINDAQLSGVRNEAAARQLAESIKQTQILERIADNTTGSAQTVGAL